ncbi:hypothetical protein LNQ52_20070 [Klebsiella pneumoniae subsp. pneumoniae]|nr:hypothetical protein [Klebsiella pneumoniae subsp. pneumoniae]
MKSWKTDAEFNKNIGLAFRAFNSLTDEGDRGRIDEIGNNPMVIRMLAKIGAEMQEDAPAGADSNPAEQQTIRDLMKSEAYMNPKHTDHERVSAQVKAYYQKRYGDQNRSVTCHNYGLGHWSYCLSSKSRPVAVIKVCLVSISH